MDSTSRVARLQIPNGFHMPAPPPLTLGTHPVYGTIKGRVVAPGGRRTGWRFMVELSENQTWTNPEAPHQDYRWGYVGFDLDPNTGVVGPIVYVPHLGYRGKRYPAGHRREKRTVPLALRHHVRSTLAPWLATHAETIAATTSLERVHQAVTTFTGARARVDEVRKMLADAEGRVAEQATIVARQTESWQPQRALIEGLNVFGRIVPGDRPTEVTVELGTFVAERRSFPRGRFSYTPGGGGHWQSTRSNLSRYDHERLTMRTFKMVHRVIDPAMDVFLTQQFPLGLPQTLADGGTAVMLEGTRREAARWAEDLRTLEAQLADPLLVTEDAILYMLRADHPATRELAILTLGALAAQLDEPTAVAAPPTGVPVVGQISLAL